MEFEELFERATGFAPFPYQKEWATREEMPSLVSVPTGLGKTAGAIMAWLWRRKFSGKEMRKKTPRRLVYCLPMRVLVEQTRDCAISWLRNLSVLAEDSPDKHPADKVGVHVLMGGDLEHDWDRWPDRDQILIGTQDMLLSRALNRGYAMSRFRWPVQYGLLNNDCLWVMDEVQLMGNGLATTAQLQAFRRKLGTVGGTHSTWMSATMRPEWLGTVDFDRNLDAPTGLEISDTDRQQGRDRLFAEKKLEKAAFEASKDGKAEADLALAEHSPKSRTLIVMNTVKRAQLVFEALRKRKPSAEIVLLHSRFRQLDREDKVGRLLAEPSEPGSIAVSTQVIEAGVDVSAKLLITDLAPWASLVQRFGRCNRKGEYNDTHDARVVWIPQPDLSDDKKLAPYTGAELQNAIDRLAELTDVAPGRLPPVDARMSYSHVVRKKDLIELFDTTPDLAGADIDVSRFIRETDDRHVQVFWREVGEKEDPGPEEPGPGRQELCSVPLGDLDLSKRRAWRWDYLERRWERAKRAFPGLVLMLRSSDGGYEEELGWTGKSGQTPPLESGAEGESNDSDRLSQQSRWQTVAEHTDEVVAAIESLLHDLPDVGEPARQALLDAARWHDCGKAHPVFQSALPEKHPPGILAKSQGAMTRYGRPGFRHELASALAMLAHGLPDLAAYLAAAHHGKVRLSIRSLPHEKRPSNQNDQLFARGIWDGDSLPLVDLGGGEQMPETKLALSYMRMGEDDVTGPSWLARMLAVRDALGPFELTFLEAVMRVADWRASGDEEVK